MARVTRRGPRAVAANPQATDATADSAERDPRAALQWLLPLVTYLLVLGLYGLYAIAPLSVLNWLAGEDRVVEWAGALALFAAGVLFVLAFVRSTGAGQRIGRLRTSRNVLMLALGLAMFVAAGEELSWGQRILGWETPDSLASVNEQHEFNLHNIRLLNPLVDGGDRSQLRLFLTANRAFSLFTVGFAAGWPLLSAASSRARRMNQRLRIPVVPLWLAPLVVLIPLLVRFVDPFIPPGFSQGDVHEAKESLYSLMLAVAAWCTFRRPSVGE